MTNAEKFKKVFGYYATEMWAKPEKEFLEWINAEALEQEPTAEYSSDVISREAAIRWVKTECNPYGSPTLDFESGKKVIEHLRQMPSATSQSLTKPNKSCEDDLISRQDAIDAVGKAMPQLTTPDGCGEFDHEIQIAAEAFSDCMKIINDLPSAQPERAIKEAEK